jgi:hypothetical protein
MLADVRRGTLQCGVRLQAEVVRHAILAAVLTLSLAGCGGDDPAPRGPTSPVPPGPGPTNSAPTIDSVTTQVTRLTGPSSYIDASDTLTLTATVRDTETAVEQLQFNWSASVGGTFTGTGSRVQWKAPADAPPGRATLTLEVVERYGQNLENRVTKSAEIDLRNAAKEVGDMARQFLTDFSNTSLRDWREVMKNFSETACPDPREVQAEQRDVENHYTNFTMHDYTIGAASVTLNFGGSCLASAGDACVAVPVTWDSTDKRTNKRAVTTGIDHLAAVYSTASSRWWLCSSRFQSTSSLGHSFYSR